MNNATGLNRGAPHVPDDVWHATEEASVLVAVDVAGRVNVEWIAADDVMASLMGRNASPETDRLYLASVTPTVVAGRHRQGLVVNGVTRRGSVDGWWFADEETPPLTGPGVGATCDLMCRAFGHATAAPDGPPGWFWATMWLADALRAGATEIDDIAAWHPAIDPRDVWGCDSDELADVVAEEHRNHAFVTGWGGVQASLADGAISVAAIDPAVADWFDVGALSRTLAEVIPSAHALARAARWNADTMSWLFDAIGCDLWVPGSW